MIEFLLMLGAGIIVACFLAVLNWAKCLFKEDDENERRPYE